MESTNFKFFAGLFPICISCILFLKQFLAAECLNYDFYKQVNHIVISRVIAGKTIH